MGKIRKPSLKQGARLNRTTEALLARGVDRDLADGLFLLGWTLNKLRQERPAKLAKLGLSELMINQLLDGKRPPIPPSTLAAVLFANRFMCCVCRDAGRSIVVHHIKDWAVSRDHDAANLAVLCLVHHDKAHTRGGLSQNLTPSLLRKHKREWEAKAAGLDARIILNAARVDSDAWWLFNHVRLFSLAKDLNVKLSDAEGFRSAVEGGVIDSAGNILGRSHASGWMYAGGDGYLLYAYTVGVLHAVLDRIAVYNISDDLDRGMLSDVLKEGDFIYVQGRWNFSSQRGTAEKGPGQSFSGKRKANGVEVTFTGDRWEASANSTWSLWLRGTQSAGALLRVVVKKRETARLLKVETSVLGVCAPLGGLKTREYRSPSCPFEHSPDQDDEQDDLTFLRASEQG